MRKLALKALLLVTVSLVLFCALCRGLTLRRHHQHSQNDANAIYVWGDSRTYQGLDQARMREKLGQRVINYSAHGAGAYDLYVFAGLVPEGATCVVGASQAVVARPPKLDFCGTGWSTTGIVQLWRHGYAWPDIRRVILRSRRPEPIAETPETYAPGTRGPDNMAELRQIYGKPIPYYQDKLELVRKSLQILKEKNCRIILLDVPLEKPFRDLLANSQHRGFAKELRKLGSDIGAAVIADVKMPREDLWHDTNHLNAEGRQIMTDILIQRAFAK